MIFIVEKDIMVWVLSIFGHIHLDFMEIFQDGALPKLEISIISSDLVCFNIN